MCRQFVEKFAADGTFLTEFTTVRGTGGPTQFGVRAAPAGVGFGSKAPGTGSVVRRVSVGDPSVSATGRATATLRVPSNDPPSDVRLTGTGT